MRRREFIPLLGGAAILPIAARAQQAALPIIGFLSSASLDAVWTGFITAFHQGLGEVGFIDGQNVSIEYRWAEGQYDRPPRLAADLVGLPAALILAAGGSDPARAAKAATSSIPIAFVSASDPVKTGLVSSLNRPEGNVTGVSLLGAALDAKRVELLHDLVPKASKIAALINPNYAAAESQVNEVQAAATQLGLKAMLVMARSEIEIDAGVGSVVQQGADALVVTQDPFLNSRREKIISLAQRYSLPAIYSIREAVAAGGLISYGTHFADGFRQAGVYAGKLLKGVKPADLPVLQPTKFELVINLKTAKSLGLVIPMIMQMTADEVIE